MKLLTLLMIVMSLFASGCGNPTLETMVYEKYNGRIYGGVYYDEERSSVYPYEIKRVQRCYYYDIIKITSRQGKLKDIWEVSIYYKNNWGTTMKKVEEYSFRSPHSEHVDSMTQATPPLVDGRMRFIRVLSNEEVR